MANNFLLLNIIIAISFCCIVFAFEPSPLQDFCVADPTSSGRVNGLAFARTDIRRPKRLRPAASTYRKHIKPERLQGHPCSAKTITGLNTLGISMVRIDYAPMGINPPHTHPAATEIPTVIDGSLQVGFVTSNPDNGLITKTLEKARVRLFGGARSFQRNVGTKNAVAIAALSSQNPGVITVANAVFGSKPGISSDVLAKAFQVDKSVVQHIQAKF
ncbi:hypothetical protein DH2020_048742 [Rehmannia glutinosa]|uniref:Germin-like protein n=1 Tax=Rehmannia glutinosa TaxID=99300 RepID=A0ABR0U5J9_REHGL